MTKSSRFLSVPRRLWRRRGHGVHSPFAYDFLRRVVAQPYAFYAYPHIDTLAAQAEVRPALARLLYRLCLHVAPHPVAVAGIHAAPLVAIMDAVLPAECPRPTASPSLLTATPSIVTLFVNDAVQEALPLWQSMPCGMLFRGSRAAIIIGYDYLYHQKFDIWI